MQITLFRTCVCACSFNVPTFAWIIFIAFHFVLVLDALFTGRLLVLQARREVTALSLAAERRHTDCVRLLVDAGADVNYQDKV